MYSRETEKGKKLKHYTKQFLIKGGVPTFRDWLKFKYAIEGYAVENVYQLLAKFGYIEDKDISNKHIIDLLKKFYFIGITERLDTNLLYLYELLDFKLLFFRQNISSKYISAKDVEENSLLINKKSRIDKQIYKQAKIINRKYNLEDVNKKKRWKWMLSSLGSQLVFDTKNSIILLSNYLKNKSKIYSKTLNVVRRKSI